MLDLKEISAIENFENKVVGYSRGNARKNRLYYQKDSLKDFGYNTPDAMKGLNVSLGWAQAAVDILLERIDFTGFYSPEQSENVDWLNGIFNDNAFRETQKYHQKDSMITGTSFISLGLGDPDEFEPELLWVSENSSNFTVKYNSRNRTVAEAFRFQKGPSFRGGKPRIDTGTLYTSEATIQVERVGSKTNWVEVSRNEHDLGFVPVVPVFNNRDSAFETGRSEITPEVESLQDGIRRTLLAIEVARELFAKPLRAMVGANPEEVLKIRANGGNLVISSTAGDIAVVPGFMTAQGWQTPTFQELTGGDPSSIIQIIEPSARLAARAIGATPEYFNFGTVNPSSADAIKAAEAKLLKRVDARIRYLSEAYKKMALMSARMTGREIDNDLKQIDVVFSRTEMTTPSASADRISKLAAAGINDRVFPDWQYRELGLTETEIKQQKKLVQDNQAANSIAMLAQNAAVTPITEA